jgi:hypothetical protein
MIRNEWVHENEESKEPKEKRLEVQVNRFVWKQVWEKLYDRLKTILM